MPLGSFGCFSGANHRGRVSKGATCYSRWLPLTIAATAMFHLALLGLGPVRVEPATANGRTIAGPSGFVDESFAEIATDGRSMWLAVAGYNKARHFKLRVFRRDGEQWRRLPVPADEVSDDLPIAIAAPKQDGVGRPCLGYSLEGSGHARLSCFVSDKWQQVELPRGEGGRLGQIGANGDELFVLFEDNLREGTYYRLYRLKDDQWTTAPPLSTPPAIGQLTVGTELVSGFPGIGIATFGRAPQRLMYSLTAKQRWRRISPKVTNVGAGPMVGGPALLAGTVAYAINDAASQPWSFAVGSARIGSKTVSETQLSVGAGNAQGRVDVAAGHLWAIWQEHRLLQRGFRANLYAAEISPSGDIRRKVALWRGLSIGPGSLQVVEVAGGIYALFMRQSTVRARGLETVLRRLPPPRS